MLYKTISYCMFLLKSTNQHGVHSPFVYNFVTKGLYKKVKKNELVDDYLELKTLSKKEKKVLSKILSYFKIQEFYINKITSTKSLYKSYKLIYYNNLINIKLDDFNSDSILLIENIYKNKVIFKQWNTLIKNKNISVSIDLFHFGLIFFRKEQAKEHFTIRV